MEQFCEIRAKKGMTQEAREILKDPNYFGTMLIKMGEYDSLAWRCDAFCHRYDQTGIRDHWNKRETICFLSCIGLVRPRATGDSEVIVLGDCALNIKPTEDELVEIAHETANCARDFKLFKQLHF